MSGSVKNNVFGSSGVVLAAAGGLSWQDVVTASTVTVEAGKGYWINTTSNACTVTLPSSPAVGDQIILGDYARTWDTNAITIDSNGNNFQGEDDSYTVDYDTEGQTINLVYADSTKGWIPTNDIANALTPVAPTLQRGIFAFGTTGSAVGLSNLVNPSGVVAADVAAVDTTNRMGGSSNYGGDKAIFAFGRIGTPPLNVSRLVSNSGVIGNDVTGVGTARYGIRGVAYGSSGQAAFAFGNVDPTFYSLKNLVNSSGVVGSDVTGVGTARWQLGATEYGDGLGIFAYGVTSEGKVSVSNKINTSGVIAADVTGVGTARGNLDGSTYGGDKGIFAYSGNPSGNDWGTVTNRVSNTGVIASDGQAAGTARYNHMAASYGGDKSIFAYGNDGSSLINVSNLISNTGNVGADVSGVGTARGEGAGAGYGYS
jgi:hypothetical protein